MIGVGALYGIRHMSSVGAQGSAQNVPQVEDIALSEDSATNAVESEAPKESTEQQADLTEEEMRNTVKFEHGAFTMSKDAEGILTTGLPVIFTNTSDTDWRYTFEVTAYNLNHDVVGTPDFALLIEVPAGESVEYTVFEYLNEDVADLFNQEGITFEISKITQA